VEYQLRSFSPWLASILLDVAVGGDVVQDPAQVIFIISKNPYSTKPTYGHFELFYASSVFAFLHFQDITFIDTQHSTYGSDMIIIITRSVFAVAHCTLTQHIIFESQNVGILYVPQRILRTRICSWEGGLSYQCFL